MAEQHFAVRLKRSPAGRKPAHRRALASLGLTRFGKTIYLKDIPSVRGILYQLVHLVEVEPRQGPPPPSKRQLAKKAQAQA